MAIASIQPPASSSNRFSSPGSDRRRLALPFRCSRVEAIREEWVIEDRWWTPHPLGRHYFELVLADGRDLVVFRAIVSGRWYRQRG